MAPEWKGEPSARVAASPIPGSGTVRAALAELRSIADPTRKPGTASIGIDVHRALGVSVPNIRRVAGRIGTNHVLALELWACGVHEARILATLVADPALLNEEQMES